MIYVSKQKQKHEKKTEKIRNDSIMGWISLHMCILQNRLHISVHTHVIIMSCLSFSMRFVCCTMDLELDQFPRHH